MMGWLSVDKKTRNIDFQNLEIIMKKITVSKNLYCKYIKKLYSEYKKDIANFNNPEYISDSLKKHYAKKLKKVAPNDDLISDYKLILSDSHKATYYVLKKLNNKKENKITVFCFDMHSDTYDYKDPLWKGNVFSKLIKEEYINKIYVFGTPKFKRESIIKDIPEDIASKVKIANINQIKKHLLKDSFENIFLSIDIDCLNTRIEKYTALEYCPATILKNISYLNYDEIDKKNIGEFVKECILVKNSLGYSNLYHVGENDLDINKLIKVIKVIKNICKIRNINIGVSKNSNLIADINEINGYDYGSNTLNMLIRLIDELDGR